jgi:hypothetical protein
MDSGYLNAIISRILAILVLPEPVSETQAIQVDKMWEIPSELFDRVAHNKLMKSVLDD